MSRSTMWMTPVVFVLVAAALATDPTPCSAADDPSTRSQPAVESGLYVKVQLAHPTNMSKLRPGDVVEGSLSRDVYAADRKLFSSGSLVRLIVDRTESRKRVPNDHWPWVVKAFTPRHETYPIFKTATVAQDKSESSLQVSLISVSRMREVHAQAKKIKSGPQSSAENGAVDVSTSNPKKLKTPILVLEASGRESAPPSADLNADLNNDADSTQPDSARPQTLPAGTLCRILLLGNVSASKSKPGDVVQARLLEPVLLASKVVLPAGSLFEGRVAKKTPPRWLSRAGSLYLTFTELTVPGGNRVLIAASLAGAELDARSHTRMDAEGRLHGEHPGKAWMAINLGVTAGISKEVDDGVQLLVEAIVSSATDASTAGTARIASTCVSALYLATRHGRDVVLPRFTEMDISLDRPVSLAAASEIGTSPALAGGK